MPHAPRGCVLGLARRLADEGVLENATDRHLLQCFADDRNEAAFAQLVRRHGPMVLGVCRRVLRDPHAADDAFQAAFLALAARPRSVRSEASVATWLHQVAHRVAQRARYTATRRRTHEQRTPIPAAVDHPDELSRRETSEVLDAELRALPEAFRAPLVLCYLEGVTRDEAARHLGWTVGAVKGRLERGREMLRRRLERRGITESAALLSVLLSQGGTSAVCGPLAAATVRFATLFQMGQMTGLPPALASRANEAVRTLLLTRLRSIFLPVLLIGVVAGAGMWVSGAETNPAGAEPVHWSDARTAEPVPPDGGRAEAGRTDHFGDPLPAGSRARLGTVRLRHGSSVFSVAFLADGKQVLSAGNDGLVRLWDVATGQEVRRFGTPGPIPPRSLAVALSSDGKTLATCDGDVGVSLWEVATGRETGHLKALKKVFALAFAPGDRTLAAASPDGLVVLWDLSKSAETRRLDGRPRFRASGPDDLTALSVTSKIESIVLRSNGAAGGGHGIWNDRGVPHLAFSADGRTLLAATYGFYDRSVLPVVRLWDVATGQERRPIEVGNEAVVVSAALAPDGTAVGWADNSGHVHIADIATGKEVRYISGAGPKENHQQRWEGFSSGRVRTRFAFVPNGSALITQTVGSGGLVVWDLGTGKEVRRLGTSVAPAIWPAGTCVLMPPGLAVSPDGKVLASAGDGNTIALFDLTSGREIHPRYGHATAVNAVRYSPDGRTLTTLGGDGSIRIWDVSKNQETRQARLPDVTLTSSVSADGRLVASSRGDDQVRLTETGTGKERGLLAMPSKGAFRLALTPDGKTLAVGGDSSPTVRLHDVATGKVVKVLEPPGEEKALPSPGGGLVVPFSSAPPPVFSADGRLLAAPGRDTLDVWDVVTGQRINRFALPENRAVRGAAFTPDGRSIALALIGRIQQACNDPVVAAEDLEDETLALWEISSGKEVRLYGRKPSPLKCAPFEGAPPGFALPIPRADPVLLAISPDGRMLAHNRGREVSVWDVRSGKEWGRFKGHQGAVLAGAFSPDSATLTTTSTDTTALVWDLATLPQR